MSYIGFAEDDDERSWTEEFLVQELTEHLKSGDVVIPGFTVAPENMPEPMNLGLPPKPTLNVLTFSDKKMLLVGS